jgi:hypothetical protein
VSILLYDTPLAPYWRRAYGVGDAVTIPAMPLVSAVTDAAAVLAECDALDASLSSLLLATGGANYSSVAQLTYRQVFGANGYAWNGSALWMYQKVRGSTP